MHLPDTLFNRLTLGKDSKLWAFALARLVLPSTRHSLTHSRYAARVRSDVDVRLAHSDSERTTGVNFCKAEMDCRLDLATVRDYTAASVLEV
jgi:hypothetical protein